MVLILRLQMLPNLKPGYCEMARSIEIVIPPANPWPAICPAPHDTSGLHPSAALPADTALQLDSLQPDILHSDSLLPPASTPQPLTSSVPLADVPEQHQTADVQLPGSSATCEAARSEAVRLEDGRLGGSNDGGSDNGASQSREAEAAEDIQEVMVAAEEVGGSPHPVTEADEGVHHAAAQVNVHNSTKPLWTDTLLTLRGTLAG